MKELLAILDVGKTNTKLILAEAHSGREVFSAKRNNTSIDTLLGRELDVAAIEQWFCDVLRSTPHTAQVAALVPIAHGATAVLIDADGNVLAAPDYEDPRFNEVATAYERVRDNVDITLSPPLPLGLNLGRQLYYFQTRTPVLFARAAHILLYPQYWAWRFSGVLSSEVTSLGCHTDLWQPVTRTFSPLATAQGWDRLLPAIRGAHETLGGVTPQMAQATGLDRSCRVVCGIHDSNASYLEHLLNRDREQPFAVISSGTWTVVMANRGDLTRLRADHDMLANVDAFGSPVPTARFMGGREYEAIAQSATPIDLAALQSVLRQQAYALPSFANAGPFPGRTGKLIGAAALNDAERAGLATLYIALMSDLLLDSLGMNGDVIVDGPLAANPFFASLLKTLRPLANVYRKAGASGVCSRAASYLAGFQVASESASPAVSELELPQLDAYRRAWCEQLPY